MECGGVPLTCGMPGRRFDSRTAMQSIIEELIRGTGYFALRLVTLGRYRSSEDSRLAEGAIGFGLVCGIAYVMVAISRG